MAKAKKKAPQQARKAKATPKAKAATKAKAGRKKAQAARKKVQKPQKPEKVQRPKKAQKKAPAKSALARKVAARKASPKKKPVARKAAPSTVAKAPAKAPVKGTAKARAKVPAKAHARKAAATPAPKAKPAPPAPARLNRDRRRLADVENTAFSAEAEDRRLLQSARSGHDELAHELRKHTETSPELTAGDVDANWQDAYAVGDEAPGGDNPTPDQDRVDDIGRALGVEYDDDEELMGGAEIAERDSHRWELDPASRDDDE